MGFRATTILWTPWLQTPGPRTSREFTAVVYSAQFLVSCLDYLWEYQGRNLKLYFRPLSSV